MSEVSKVEGKHGMLFALSAYTIWGFAPIYFVWVAFAQSLEIVAHRVFWAFPFLALIIWSRNEFSLLRTIDRNRLLGLLCSSLCLTINWFTFVYAVQMEKIAAASLGYFMNPLVSVFLGWLVLRETLGRLQWFAVALAVFAILIELSLSQSFPFVSVVLAVSFGFYGLIRKRLAVPSILGLFVETSFVWPMAAVFLFLSGSLGGDRDVTEIGMLAIGGLVTIVPLLCFASAALRLRLVTLGFIQYLAPTISLLVAILIYEEAVEGTRWMTFGLIWLAIAIFSIDGMREIRQMQDEDGSEIVKG